MKLKGTLEPTVLLKLMPYKKAVHGQIQYYIVSAKQENIVITAIRHILEKLRIIKCAAIPHVSTDLNFVCSTVGIKASPSVYSLLTNGADRYIQQSTHFKVDKFAVIPDTTGGAQCLN